MGRIGKHLGRNSHRIGSMKLILWSVLICVPLLVNGRGNCVVCKEKEVTHIVWPCAHYCLCDCQAEGEDDIPCKVFNNVCPLCREQVDKITKVKEVFNVGDNAETAEESFNFVWRRIRNTLHSIKGDAFALARENMATKVEKFMEGKQQNMLSKLKAAIIERDLESIKELIAKGVDVNANDSTSNSFPLMWAVECQFLGSFGLLVDSGADVNQMLDGVTALWYAASKGYAGCVEQLLAKDAAVDLRSKKGRTPLFIAAENGHDRCVEVLLSQAQNDAAVKAMVDQVNNNGITPLDTAVYRCELKCVIVLLRYGATNSGDFEDNFKPGMPIRRRSSKLYGDERTQKKIRELIEEAKKSRAGRRRMGETQLPTWGASVPELSGTDVVTWAGWAALSATMILILCYLLYCLAKVWRKRTPQPSDKLNDNEIV